MCKYTAILLSLTPLIIYSHRGKDNQGSEEVEDSTGPSGRLTGQGSHFTSGTTTGQSYLFSLYTANVVSGTDPRDNTGLTGGPGTGGTEHGTTTEPSSGSAAIGETTTYSSQKLSPGDPISSVIDNQSDDPITYKKPESSRTSGGVTSGAAQAAAGKAFHDDQQRKGWS